MSDVRIEVGGTLRLSYYDDDDPEGVALVTEDVQVLGFGSRVARWPVADEGDDPPRDALLFVRRADGSEAAVTMVSIEDIEPPC